MKTYLIFLIICSTSVFIISFLLMFDKKNENEDFENMESDRDLIELEEVSEQTNNTDPKKDSQIELIIVNREEKPTKNNYKKMLIVSGKSKQLILFSIISILQFPFPTLMFSLYRGIGEYKKIDMKYLQSIGSVNFIFECFSSFIFGILCDYVNLKYLLLFIIGVDTFISLTYCFTFNNSFLFFLVTNFVSFSAGGYYPLQDCYLMKVFGTFIYIELNSYVSFLTAFIVTLMTPIAYFIEAKIEIKDNAYWILFIGLGILNLIGTILGLFIDETPFNFKEKIQKRKKIEEDEENA